MTLEADDRKVRSAAHGGSTQPGGDAVAGPRDAAEAGVALPPSSADTADGVDPPAHPSDEQMLDVALQYTFPASDPIAVDCCRVRALAADEGGAESGPGASLGA